MGYNSQYVLSSVSSTDRWFVWMIYCNNLVMFFFFFFFLLFFFFFFDEKFGYVRVCVSSVISVFPISCHGLCSGTSLICMNRQGLNFNFCGFHIWFLNVFGFLESVWPSMCFFFLFFFFYVLCDM